MRYIFLCALLVVNFALAYFYFATKQNSQLSGRELTNFLMREMANCKSSDSSNQCYNDLAKRLAERFAVSNVLETIIENERQPEFFSDCHELLHFLGRESFSKFNDAAEAISAGNTVCFAGYYHGVMEGYILKRGFSFGNKEHMDKAAKETIELCKTLNVSGLPIKKFNECLHGLGHAFMFLTDGELPEALSMCDFLRSQHDADWCYSGAFMENSTSSTNPDHPGRYLRNDDPLYPCSILKEKYLRSCYMLQGSYFLNLSGGDWSKTIELCENVPRPYNINCVNMLGQSQVNSVQNPSDMKKNCMFLIKDEYRDTCIEGTIGAMGERFEKDASLRSIEFCSVFEPAKKELCFEKFFRTLFTWIKNQSEYKAVCESIPEEHYRELCSRSAELNFTGP